MRTPGRPGVPASAPEVGGVGRGRGRPAEPGRRTIPALPPPPMRLALPFLALLVAASGCSSTAPTAPTVDLAARANALTHDALLVDTHIDVPYRLRETPDDVGAATETGDFDYPRALAGGLDVAFMSIYIPASYQETGGARALADSLIDMVEGIAAGAPDRFAVVRSVADVDRLRSPRRVLLALGMENGAPVEGDLANLRHFRDRGIRYVTLTHSRDNEISDSSYDDAGTWGGLSDFGRDVVREMNRLGIMVDVSHVSDAAFDDVMDVTTVPVIASHSSARAFTPGFERNMSDAMIERLAENGGVVQINFGSTFLLKRVQDDRDALRARFAADLEARGLVAGSPEADAFQTDLRRREPPPARRDERRRRPHRPRRPAGRRRPRRARVRLRRRRADAAGRAGGRLDVPEPGRGAATPRLRRRRRPQDPGRQRHARLAGRRGRGDRVA